MSNNKDHSFSIEDSSSYPDHEHDVYANDDDDLELGLGLSIGGGIITTTSSSSSSSSSIVVGWPPLKKAHRLLTKNINKGHHLSVKVNMDGTLIGRKVDLYAQTSYQTLAHTLEDMFFGRWSSITSLLSGTSEFVLTYQDKDGDWMLVGDVPWQMFLSSVKRLRILRNPKMQH